MVGSQVNIHGHLRLMGFPKITCEVIQCLEDRIGNCI